MTPIVAIGDVVTACERLNGPLAPGFFGHDMPRKSHAPSGYFAAASDERAQVRYATNLSRNGYLTTDHAR